MNRIAWLLFLATTLSACTSMGRLEKGATSIATSESVVVLGVSPDGYRLAIFPGSVEDGAFRQNPWRPAAFAGHPEDGFVVARVSAGDTLAITTVTAVTDKDSIMGARFAACGGTRTMVFSAPDVGGKVLYLGNVHYDMAGGKIGVKYSSNIDAAKQYMDSNYPAFSGRLEPWRFDLLPINASCTRTIYVPVYVPSR